MKKLFVFLFLITGVVLLGVTSCKKEKLQTPFTRVLGKWKKTKYATDDNANGVIESREIHLVEAGIDNRIEFKSDSTGVETTNTSPDLKFRWQIVNGASILVQYSANDTVIYRMVNVSSVDLTLTTESKLGLLWYYYSKI